MTPYALRCTKLRVQLCTSHHGEILLAHRATPEHGNPEMGSLSGTHIKTSQKSHFDPNCPKIVTQILLIVNILQETTKTLLVISLYHHLTINSKSLSFSTKNSFFHNSIQTSQTTPTIQNPTIYKHTQSSNK